VWATRDQQPATDKTLCFNPRPAFARGAALFALRLEREFPIVHLVTHDRAWLGLNDDDLLDERLAADQILVAHDRRPLADAATRSIRERQVTLA
jgi:hypothetical protein